MKRFFTSLTLLLLCISCSSDTLSNEEASNAIKEIYPKYCTTNKMITHSYRYPGTSPDPKNREALRVFTELEKQGWVTIDLKMSGFTSNPNKDYYITPTEKSISSFGEGLPITQAGFFEVVDISQNENEAIVVYKVKNTQTPYYQLHNLNNKYNRSNNKPICTETEWEEEITFIKFDKGWRIKS